MNSASLCAKQPIAVGGIKLVLSSLIQREMTGGGRWVGIHSWQEETSQASKNARILSVAHIGDNQGAFCSQEQPGLSLSDLTPPFLSHCVNVKVTISLADNYFHVYWQGSNSGLKNYCEPCMPGSQHPLTISLVSPVTYRMCYFSPVSNPSKCWISNICTKYH